MCLKFLVCPNLPCTPDKMIKHWTSGGICPSTTNNLRRLGHIVILIMRERLKNSFKWPWLWLWAYHFDIISCVYTGFPRERPLQRCSIISVSLYRFLSILLSLPSHIPPGGVSRQHYPKHCLKPYTFLMGCGTGTQVGRPELKISGQVTGLWVRWVQLVDQLDPWINSAVVRPRNIEQGHTEGLCILPQREADREMSTGRRHKGNEHNYSKSSRISTLPSANWLWQFGCAVLHVSILH